MSCGQIALKELGIIPEIYYASEIDKFAIAQAQLNFPDTIQLGDMTRWREWDIDWASIDIILAGTPCQGFSFAGKQLAFDDPRSALFFVFVDILNHCKRCNPNVKFLLENVRMKKEYMRIISEHVGVYPVNINSNLVSAQNRDRWYWSNIRTRQEGLFGEIYTDIPQPEDRGILLKGILEEEVDEKCFISDAAVERMIRKTYSKSAIDPDKVGSLNTKNNLGSLSMNSGTTFISVDVGHKSVIQLNPAKNSVGNQPYQQDRIYDTNGISPTLMAEMSCGAHAILQRARGYNKGGIKSNKTPTICGRDWVNSNVLIEFGFIRRLTPTECARLQTIPSWYKWNCSETQQYKMLGNGWTVEVIKHILSFMPCLAKN